MHAQEFWPLLTCKQSMHEGNWNIRFFKTKAKIPSPPQTLWQQLGSPPEHQRALELGAATVWPWTPQSGEAEDAGTGLATLLGAFTFGAGFQPEGPSEPSFSFLLPELLGSGCPVCEETCRTMIRFFFVSSFVSFCSTTVQLCIVFRNLCAR